MNVGMRATVNHKFMNPVRASAPSYAEKIVHIIVVAIVFVSFALSAALATDRASTELARHFLSDTPACVQPAPSPVLLVADLTLNGEIDDSVSLHIYSILEELGCIDVLGVVSIFGNGGSTTAEVHRNLDVRLAKLGGGTWRLLRGPDESYRKVRNKRATRPPAGQNGTLADQERLVRIAEIVNGANGQVVIVELGPMTVSARLLSSGLIQESKIRKILAVGGRKGGERFGRPAGLVGRLGSFTDFNVRKDTKAVDSLIRNWPEKMFLVTYRSGVGQRMITADMIANAIPAISEHATERQQWLRRMLGYEGIPSWDTWTAVYFVRDGKIRLDCGLQYGHVRMEDGARWPRLLIGNQPDDGWPIEMCR
ncbi:hypothetical protein DEM25_004070 [Oceaniradius stylonematis]|uniref:Inosine/uridine-preferring nucleoside hydrolase domain-containing protein n=2 Tax=Oceaniradius stylonematis TaxID=2184161 RepID=A0A3A8AMW3_9HYPH|nr:hypothetical protein DEM25_004070 [Oceaniradius stylonematis]